MTELSEVEAFLFHEARLLDDRRFDEWLKLFTDTATYWVPSQPGQHDPHRTVSLIYDDRRLLETRVRRLANPSMHAQRPPSRTSHLIGNVTIEEARADGLATACVFQMLEYRLDRQRVFGGFCRHDLVRTDDGFRIRAKRVELVNCDSLLEGIATLL